MPTKGNPQLGTRVSHALYKRIQDQLALSAVHRRKGPFTVAEFLEIAAQEKLDKMARSRRGRGRGAVLRERLTPGGICQHDAEAPIA